MESFSAQIHGVEPDVDDDLEAGSLERHRVRGPVNQAHARVARRDNGIAQRVDRNAVAGKSLCEGWVGNVIERYEDAGDRREQREDVAIERLRARIRGGRGSGHL